MSSFFVLIFLKLFSPSKVSFFYYAVIKLFYVCKLHFSLSILFVFSLYSKWSELIINVGNHFSNYRKTELYCTRYYLRSALNLPKLFSIFSMKKLLTYVLQKCIFLFFFSNKFSREKHEVMYNTKRKHGLIFQK